MFVTIDIINNLVTTAANYFVLQCFYSHFRYRQCEHLELQNVISAKNAKTPCYSLHAFVESFIAYWKEIIFKGGNNLKVIYKK